MKVNLQIINLKSTPRLKPGSLSTRLNDQVDFILKTKDNLPSLRF